MDFSKTKLLSHNILQQHLYHLQPQYQPQDFKKIIHQNMNLNNLIKSLNHLGILVVNIKDLSVSTHRREGAQPRSFHSSFRPRVSHPKIRLRQRPGHTRQKIFCIYWYFLVYLCLHAASWLGPDYISIIDYCYDAGPRLPVKNLYFQCLSCLSVLPFPPVG